MIQKGRKSAKVKISLVVPIYNEEESILPFLERAIPVLEKIGFYEIIFCMDPSTDRSEKIIRDESKRNPSICLLSFSRRFGQPAATMAGILNCRGETCGIIDVDLQDPPELLNDMYKKLNDGYELVYAKRKSRKGESLVKLFVSYIGYMLIQKLSDVHIPRNTGDFRIITRKIIEDLRPLSEKHGFLRGLVAFVGYKHAEIEYDRSERGNGKGKYNRMLGSVKIGLNGLLGFSTFPLSLIMWVGFFISILAAIGIILMIFYKLVLGVDFPLGVPTLTVLLLFFGGIQLMGIGLLGEYIGRIYEEVRDRPRFIVDQAVNLSIRSRDGR